MIKSEAFALKLIILILSLILSVFVSYLTIHTRIYVLTSYFMLHFDFQGVGGADAVVFWSCLLEWDTAFIRKILRVINWVLYKQKTKLFSNSNSPVNRLKQPFFLLNHIAPLPSLKKKYFKTLFNALDTSLITFCKSLTWMTTYNK